MIISDYHHRHSIRLRGYDYSQNGYYFVTICTYKRAHIFGAIRESPLHMEPNEHGQIIENVWKSLPKKFPIELDQFQIMPNHAHMIIIVVGANHDSPQCAKDIIFHRPLLSQIIGYFKMNTAKMIHNIDPNIQIWQRNYFERIIRNEKEYFAVRQYIKDNPKNWGDDEENMVL